MFYIVLVPVNIPHSAMCNLLIRFPFLKNYGLNTPGYIMEKKRFLVPDLCPLETWSLIWNIYKKKINYKIACKCHSEGVQWEYLKET